jgi:hypothetical protein
MANTQPLAREAFENLLSEMPRIAEAVNLFTSQENQRTALDALLSPFRLPQEPPARAEAARPGLSVVQPADAAHDNGALADEPTPAATSPSGSGRRRGRKKPAAPRAKDINFRPEGKQSLRDFAAEKTPASFAEMNLVVVYYLEEVLAIPAIEAGHVLAAYTECGWRVPTDPVNALIVTASRKKWLDTSDMKAIHLTFQGRNTVQHDMPRPKAQKSA